MEDDYQRIDQSIIHDSFSHDYEQYNYDGCQCWHCSDAKCHQSRRVYDDTRRLLRILNKNCSELQNPVIECNDSCLCSIYCWNRVVQLGSSAKLECFKTQSKGLGVRTTDKLIAGQFVCEYLGQVVSVHEAKSRFSQSDLTKPNYLLVLREHITNFSNPHILITCIDATKFGNIARFINHSCSPNLLAIAVRINTNVPHLAFFAKRDIAPNEELTFDYAGGYRDNYKQETSHGIKCLCQSETCFGYLPYDQMLFDESK